MMRCLFAFVAHKEHYMSTLTNEEHTILTALRDRKLAFHDAEREALEKLLAVVAEKRDLTALSNTVRSVAHGVENLMRLMSCGSDIEDSKPYEVERLPQSTIIFMIHLQWMRNLLNDKPCVSWTPTCSEVFEEWFGYAPDYHLELKEKLIAAGVATADQLEAVSAEDGCSNPMCRAHRHWWRSS